MKILYNGRFPIFQTNASFAAVLIAPLIMGTIRGQQSAQEQDFQYWIYLLYVFCAIVWVMPGHATMLPFLYCLLNLFLSVNYLSNLWCWLYGSGLAGT